MSVEKEGGREGGNRMEREERGTKERELSVLRRVEMGGGIRI